MKHVEIAINRYKGAYDYQECFHAVLFLDRECVKFSTCVISKHSCADVNVLDQFICNCGVRKKKWELHL